MRTTKGAMIIRFSSLLFMTTIALFSLGVANSAEPDEPINNKQINVVDYAELQYPPLARSALIQGVVVVRAKLDEKGNVVDAMAISGADTLIPACLDNARKWRFRPNAGKAVIIVYNFRIVQALTKSEHSHFALELPNFVTITAPAPEVQ